MSIQALRASTPEITMARAEVDEGVLRKDREKRDGLPLGYIIRNDDLDQLRQLKDLVVDRGRKNQAKALSSLLLGLARIPLISGTYTSAGQLRRSLRTLLHNAQLRGDRNVYVIGADAKVFQALWQTVGPLSVTGEKGRRQIQAIPQKTSISTGPVPCTSLLDLMLPDEVSQGLLERLVGESTDIQVIRQLIVRAARTDAPVLIMGENGTGKEVVANAIHDFSPRHLKDLIPVNCAGVPRDLLESGLFGYVKGAFTGADRDRDGLWKIADGGTLLLDEVGDLTLPHQAKILRALDNNEVWPVGASKSTTVNVRVIAATNRDLLAMVDDGEFRQDLYYRLRGLPIFIPPFRDRVVDIPHLAIHFWRRITNNPDSTLPPEVLTELQTFPWPGNAREIRSVLQMIYVMCGEKNISAAHVRSAVPYHSRSPLKPRTPSSAQDVTRHRVESFRHIRRTDDVVRAVEVSLRPLVGERRTDPDSIAKVRSALCRRIEELELLCLHPLLFRSEVTFAIIHQLKGKASYFLSLLDKDVHSALAYCKGDLSELLKLARQAIFEEAGQLTGKC